MKGFITIVLRCEELVVKFFDDFANEFFFAARIVGEFVEISDFRDDLQTFDVFKMAAVVGNKRNVKQ